MSSSKDKELKKAEEIQHLLYDFTLLEIVRTNILWRTFQNLTKEIFIFCLCSLPPSLSRALANLKFFLCFHSFLFLFLSSQYGSTSKHRKQNLTRLQAKRPIKWTQRNLEWKNPYLKSLKFGTNMASKHHGKKRKGRTISIKKRSFVVPSQEPTQPSSSKPKQGASQSTIEASPFFFFFWQHRIYYAIAIACAIASELQASKPS